MSSTKSDTNKRSINTKNHFVDKKLDSQKKLKTNSKTPNKTTMSRKNIQKGGDSNGSFSLKFTNVKGDGKCFFRAIWRVLRANNDIWNEQSQILHNNNNSNGLDENENRNVKILQDYFINSMKNFRFIKLLKYAFENMSGLYDDLVRNTNMEEFKNKYEYEVYKNDNDEIPIEKLQSMISEYAALWEKNRNKYVTDFDVNYIKYLLYFDFNLLISIYNTSNLDENMQVQNIEQMFHEINNYETYMELVNNSNISKLSNNSLRKQKRVSIIAISNVHYYFGEFFFNYNNVNYIAASMNRSLFLTIMQYFKDNKNDTNNRIPIKWNNNFRYTPSFSNNTKNMANNSALQNLHAEWLNIKEINKMLMNQFTINND